MCSVFQTRGVRKRSQKSWLVAASSSKIARATMPNASNGKPLSCRKLVLPDNSATKGSTGEYEKYHSKAAFAWVRATAQVSTPKCLRLYSSGRNRLSSRAAGPMQRMAVRRKKAQVPKAAIRAE